MGWKIDSFFLDIENPTLAVYEQESECSTVFPPKFYDFTPKNRISELWCSEKLTMGFPKHTAWVPSGKRLHNELERSTIFAEKTHDFNGHGSTSKLLAEVNRCVRSKTQWR